MFAICGWEVGGVEDDVAEGIRVYCDLVLAAGLEDLFDVGLPCILQGIILQ